MNAIYKVAKMELRTMFYSPIAWIILVIFTFQIAMIFCNLFSDRVDSITEGYNISNVTLGLFQGNPPYRPGIFSALQEYLYLYIPLLTMGLLSSEISRGSIKLLYSSPITSGQIIMGKFLSVMIYALLLAAITTIFIVFSVFTVEMFDWKMVLVGLLGVYLLMCAYGAIGLFMSSFTSYQVVAAMATLAMLAVLNFIGDVGQEYEFVRDITYWLSVKGRASTMARGMLCSEDLLYFVIVIALFLVLTIMKIQFERRHIVRKVKIICYGGIVCVALLVGYLTSWPAMKVFYDATQTKKNTLTPNSQEIVKKLEGGLTMTTYVNLFDNLWWYGKPDQVREHIKLFEQYTRFKPEIKTKYVYYSVQKDSLDPRRRFKELKGKERFERMARAVKMSPKRFLTESEINRQIDLKSEEYRMVRLLERDNGQKTFLRMYDDMYRVPFESEISAALKRLVMKLPVVAFVTGHEERSLEIIGNSGYNTFTKSVGFRQALINQGFEVIEVELARELPSRVNILVLAEPRKSLSGEEMKVLNRYIERGGNLIILGNPGRQEIMNPLVDQFGVQFMDGILVQPTKDYLADEIANIATEKWQKESYIFANAERNAQKYNSRRLRQAVIMPGCCALSYHAIPGFYTFPLFILDTIEGWNELNTTNFVDEVPVWNPEIGEQKGAMPTMVALTRKIGEREQKIIISGDADCISNGAFNIQRRDVRQANYNLVTGLFFWLSDGEVPVDVRRPDSLDNNVYVSQEGMKIVNIAFMGILPLILVVMGAVVCGRRKRK